MAQPTAGDVHVNRPLTNISIAYLQDQKNFIAAEVFPLVPVQKQSDLYWEYDARNWNRDEMKVRVSGTPSAGGGYKVSAQNSYFAKVWAFHKDVADPTRANADNPLNLDNEATQFCTMKALIRREKEFAGVCMATGVWGWQRQGVSATPSAGTQVLQWNDANATPIQDVRAAKKAVLKATGLEPNKLVLGYDVYNTLIDHPTIIDRVKYGQVPGKIAMVDVSELAQVFKVEQVLVMRAIEEQSIEESAASSTDFIGGKKALLVYAPPAPGLLIPSAGYIFSWVGYLGAGPAGNRIKRFRVEENAADRIEIEMAFDLKRISTVLGAYFYDIVA